MTRTPLNTTLDGYEVWFVTGSQNLYGEETLRQVAEQSQAVADGLGDLPVRRRPAERLGSMSMIDVAPDGTLWIAERCGANDCLANGDVDPILHVGADGAWLGAFGAGVFAWPHGIYVDPGGNVWVTDARGGDDRGHQVIKFAPDGRELMRLGTSAHAGDGPTHFNGPTDVVVARERQRVRQRRPRADVEQSHREVRGRRHVTSRNGAAPAARRVSSSCRTRSRSTRRAACSSPTATTTGFRSSIRTATSWSSGRSSAGRAAFTSRPTTRCTCRTINRTTSAIRGWPRGIYVGSAKDGSVQRVHSGSRVRSGARARDRRARPSGRRRRHDLRRRGLFAERQEVRALTGG